MDYKKILEGVVNIISTTEKSDIGFANICTYIGEHCPELKDEDERIRKEILDCFRTMKQQGCFPSKHKEQYNSWIAWLEKQGEQPKKVSIWKHWKDGIAGGAEGEQIFLIKIGRVYSISSCLGCECDYIELSELDKLLSEKQGEQKFSDIDNKFLRMRETKPANIVEFLDRLTTVEQEFLWEHIEKVKKVDREEREQKPFWSEEDNKIIEEIIYDIECARAINYHAPKEGYEFRENWLKSLKERYTWKPSDEQMKIVKDAIGIYGAHSARGLLFEDLYQDLKKLKEE